MSRRQRIVKRSIFIACEGHTEEYYFKALREIVNDSPRYSVSVELLDLKDGVRQDPMGLVEAAKSINDEEGYDEVWAVFDKDRDRDVALQNAFAFARQHNIQIAFSSIAFEHWILLHFEKNNTAFERSDCESRGDVCECNGQRCTVTYMKQTHFEDYRKGSVKLYSQVSPLNAAAIENAAWLKFQNRQNLSATLEIQYPYNLNPHTDVDNLLIKLLELDRMIYSEVGVSRQIGQLMFEVTSFADKSLVLRLTNNSQTMFVVNAQGDFKLKDSNDILYPHSIPAAVQILPDETKVATLTFDFPDDAEITELRL
jgi:hypothetical protein